MLRYVPRGALGTRTSGTTTTLTCPDSAGGATTTPDRAAYGLNIRSGWFTDGIALRCRTYR